MQFGFRKKGSMLFCNNNVRIWWVYLRFQGMHALRHIQILSGTIRDLFFFKNISVLLPERYVFQIEIKGSEA
jgi:hypothetical protein